MSSSNPNPDLRLAELLAEQTLSELTAEQAAELASLAGSESSPEFDAEMDAYERALAALQVAVCAEQTETPPNALTERLLADAADFFAKPSAAPVLPFKAAPPAEEPTRSVSNAPWLLAAAALLLAVAGWWPQASGDSDRLEISAAAQLSALVEQAPGDLLRLDWAALSDPTVSENSSGEIIWSDSKQEGYMRFAGLAVNDPQVEQYQLWIFDRAQDVAYPIDGGVFDVNSDGEVVVPIRAKIEVSEAFQFAITVEKPGGVVVSSRERLPLLAAVSG